MLSDYFRPLNLGDLALVVFLFFIMDSIGCWFDKRFIKSPQFLRPAIWLYGLSLLVFTWFLLHFWWPFNLQTVGLSILFWQTIVLFEYIKERQWMSLFSFCKKYFWSGLILLPLLPALFVKSSLPPYLTDETRYHFLSPYQVKNELKWYFGTTDIYAQLPRFLDTMFVVIFSITKTYSLSRLLHFAIFYTTIWAMFAWLKDRFNTKTAIIFNLLYLYLVKDVLIIGTSGYIDYSTAGLTMIAIVLSIDYVLWQKNTLTSAVIFWGLANGSKYSTLLALGISAVFIVLSRLYKKPKIKILKLIILWILFGGYWYIKNWIFTGNPIYPFLFGCKFAQCSDVRTFFSGWTIPVTINFLPKILSEISYGHTTLIVLLIIGLYFVLKNKTIKIKSILGIFFVYFIGEMIFAKYVSGFESRYLKYLQIILTAIFSIVLVHFDKIRWYFIIGLSFVVYVICVGLQTTYDPWKYLSLQEIRFTIGKSDIYSWIKDRHPLNKELIYLCGDDKKKTVYVLDNYLWNTKDEQRFSIFNISCEFSDWTQLESDVDQSKRGFYWLATTKECDLLSSEFSQKALCNSQRVGKTLYKFIPK